MECFHPKQAKCGQISRPFLPSEKNILNCTWVYTEFTNFSFHAKPSERSLFICIVYKNLCLSLFHLKNVSIQQLGEASSDRKIRYSPSKGSKNKSISTSFKTNLTRKFFCKNKLRFRKRFGCKQYWHSLG